MHNFHLTAEQIEIRDTVRDFVKAEVKPLAEKSERMEALDHRPMWSVLDKASEMGLRTLALSEAHGGTGADALTGAIVTEELAVGDPDTAAILAETSTLGGLLFGKLMSPAQQARFLPAFQEDKRYHLAFAASVSETELGINYHTAYNGPHKGPVMTASAVRAGKDWVINGVAAVAANAPLAKLIVVSASTDPNAAGTKGASVFLVPRETAGLTVTEYAPGRFLGSSGKVTFKDCKVSADNLLAANANGILEAAVWGGRGSPHLAAVNLGIGRAAYEAAVDYAKLRVQGGRPIIEHQAIATKLADSAIRLEVARSAVWKAAWASEHPDALADHSLPDLPLTTLARTFTAEALYRAVKDCAEVFGAMGVMRDMPLQKFIQDARMCLHTGAGAADAKLEIAEAIAGYRRA